jgi:hypothetical protein
MVVADLRSGRRSTKIAYAREREIEENDLNTNLKESHESWGESKGSGPVGV